MLKFALKILIIGCVATIPYGIVQYQNMTVDDTFYWKSTYAAPSLLLGGSRALKGISPGILEQELNLGQKSVLNFAFNGNHSPYGEKYFNLIKRKIKIQDERAIFVLSVIPMSIMDIKDLDFNRENEFRFYDLFNVNMNPNIEYILRNPRANKSFLQKIYELKSTPEKKIVHSNGWEEMTIEINSNTKIGRPVEQLIKYDMEKSPEREIWFRNTVEYLSNIGQVYMVRLPISSLMLQKEEALYPEFDAEMEQIATRKNVHYFNFAVEGKQYEFTDSHHHLNGQSAIRFSKKLATSIKSSH